LNQSAVQVVIKNEKPPRYTTTSHQQQAMPTTSKQQWPSNQKAIFKLLAPFKLQQYASVSSGAFLRSTHRGNLIFVCVFLETR